ncbi:zf-TFIIB domain-containing protein [Nannocystis bainbridge]|uniref:Zf-TFIIB domain-containing protein n=1 Tax=Nannocystis bainbridge TaxID=2995303 RepID=A0ABT5E415_9BACT|nr:zf-TFIIB domain-containing protein [Nannocystis bainbridge]MDC0720608.1 zf-TFIIB domain-containing protein [Nannocystis bainbridge]
MRRPRPTEESRARAARISQALADLLPDEPARPPEYRDPGARTPRGGDCPGCGEPLHATAVRHGIEFDTCAGCGGIWLDAGELEVLTSGLDPSPGTGAMHEADLRARVPAPATRESDVRYRECPRCREVMNRRNFGSISGVIVDECRHHGLFLDAGELEEVEAFLRAGGRAIGEAARARAAARSVPPPPPQLETGRPVKQEIVAESMVDALWSLLFR